MTLDEAALIWGRSIREDRLTPLGSWSELSRVLVAESAKVLVAELGLFVTRDDEWPHFTNDYVGLACVMYAQDVAEGRHR